MRILQIVTLVSPQGEYGGPTRVAINQAESLRRRGHEVTIAAGVRVADRKSEKVVVDENLRLFRVRNIAPAIGFAGLFAPGLPRYVWQRRSEYDVVHAHLARDFVTLPAALTAQIAGIPVVAQTHGMIDPSHRLLSRPLDAAATVRVLRRSQGVCYLTDHEAENLRKVAGDDIRLVPILNGVPEAEPRRPSSDGRVDVLFLARLAPRKRPLDFVKAAVEVAATHPEATFSLVGPDEGEASAVRAYIEATGKGSRVTWEGSLASTETLDRMRRASIYVLPSKDEPFPMTVLEAMSIGIPVVITETCGLADDVRRSGGGLVVDDQLTLLPLAISTILADPELRREMGEAGRQWVSEHLNMPNVAQSLENLYRRATALSNDRALGR